MVYESGFTTRRTYTSRPIVSSYAVSYPVEYKVSRLYKTTYPIYSTYTIPKRVYTGSRIFTSPVRVVTSPARVVTRVIHSPSPIRVVRTTTRVISSPERTILYTYKTPNIYNSSYLPATTYSSYSPSTYVYSTPSYYYSPISRVFTRSLSSPIRITTSPVYSTTSYLKRTLPGHGARALTNYLSTEPFATFQAETNRIRQRAQSLIRDIHSPVIRRARSCTPFPVTGYTYEPTSKLALDAYVERITNPVRHVAKEVHRISHYPEPARKYVDPELDPYRPSRKFSAPLSLDDHAGEETKEKQRLRHERLMTVGEEVLDEIQLEKKKALMKTMDDSKGREQRTLEESIQQKFKKDTKKKLIRIERKEQDEAIFKSSKQDALKVEEARLAEEAHLVENARLTEEARLAEETRKAEEDRLAKEARLAEESRLAEGRRIAEETRLKKAEEDRLAEEARLAEEEARKFEEARLAEEEARKLEEARLEEEKRLRDEELIRLAEIEKQAIDEQERELARQAAELAEIARQEAELAAQELHAMQQADQINSSDLDDTTKAATESIIEEPVTPVGEIHREPVIELSTEIDELSDTEGAAAEEEDVEEV